MDQNAQRTKWIDAQRHAGLGILPVYFDRGFFCTPFAVVIGGINRDCLVKNYLKLLP